MAHATIEQRIPPIKEPNVCSTAGSETAAVLLRFL
jgi:hypothetical protein